MISLEHESHMEVWGSMNAWTHPASSFRLCIYFCLCRNENFPSSHAIYRDELDKRELVKGWNFNAADLISLSKYFPPLELDVEITCEVLCGCRWRKYLLCVSCSECSTKTCRRKAFFLIEKFSKVIIYHFVPYKSSDEKPSPFSSEKWALNCLWMKIPKNIQFLLRFPHICRGGVIYE